MIGALVSVFSLNLALTLIQDYGVVAKTLAATDITSTSPILVTVPNHGIPLGRVLHGIVDQIVGLEIEGQDADGWLGILTPVDGNTFSLSALDAQGIMHIPTATGSYVSGGRIRYAVPDGQILLGRRNMNTATKVVTPRVVMIPTTGVAWDFGSYVGAAPDLQPAQVPNVRGSAQQQSMTTQPQGATEYLTFEVYINGSGPNYGNPLSPDYEDFDATQALAHAFATVLYSSLGGGVKILRESWPSQSAGQGLMTQRGQQWCGIVQVEIPVIKPALPYVPIGVTGSMIVQPIDPLVPEDQTTIVIA